MSGLSWDLVIDEKHSSNYAFRSTWLSWSTWLWSSSGNGKAQAQNACPRRLQGSIATVCSRNAVPYCSKARTSAINFHGLELKLMHWLGSHARTWHRRAGRASGAALLHVGAYPVLYALWKIRSQMVMLLILVTRWFLFWYVKVDIQMFDSYRLTSLVQRVPFKLPFLAKDICLMAVTNIKYLTCAGWISVVFGDCEGSPKTCY